MRQTGADRRKFDRQLVRAAGAQALIRREPWDCDRLGLEVAKLEDLKASSERAAVQVVNKAVNAGRASGLALLVCRLDARDRYATTALQQAGFALVDIVVLLSLERPRKLGSARRGVRVAEVTDLPAMAKLSGAAFSDPKSSWNRFLNDPRVPRSKVRSLYAHWARTSIAGPAADESLVFPAQGPLLGFITLKKPKKGVASIPLNAVAAAARGKGIYSLLVDAALARAWASGAKKVEIRTQVQQLAVQRTWVRRGAVPAGHSTTWSLWL